MWTYFLGLGFMPNYQHSEVFHVKKKKKKHSEGLLSSSRFWPFKILPFPINVRALNMI
jgi:hypothetical protein